MRCRRKKQIQLSITVQEFTKHRSLSHVSLSSCRGRVRTPVRRWSASRDSLLAPAAHFHVIYAGKFRADIAHTPPIPERVDLSIPILKSFDDTVDVILSHYIAFRFWNPVMMSQAAFHLNLNIFLFSNQYWHLCIFGIFVCAFHYNIWLNNRN